MMHYLIRRDNGGKPRDKWETECNTDGGNNKCYGRDSSVALAFSDRHEAVMNIDNYRYWMRDRFRRWGKDWPPHTDINAGDPASLDPAQKWTNDPIGEDDWPIIDGRLSQTAWGWLRDYMELLVGDRHYEPWKP